MTGPEHYRIAEQLLERAGQCGGGYCCAADDHGHLLGEALVHATLAAAAASVLNGMTEVEEWEHVAGTGRPRMPGVWAAGGAPR